MQSLVAALKYLTLWGRIASKQQATTQGAPALYFPFIGLLLGLLLALLNYALSVYLDSQLLSIFLISFLVLVSGATHCDGTKRTLDALLSRPREENSSLTTFGLLILFVFMLFKIRAVEVMDDKIALSLLLAPALARWNLVVFVFGFHDRCDESCRWIGENLRLWHLLLTSATILGLAFYFLGRKGLVIAFSLTLVALLSRTWLHQHYSVITHDNLGALIESSETLSFILLASL
jgi:adenosylcobinamide-GDP ribazoletransferase